MNRILQLKILNKKLLKNAGVRKHVEEFEKYCNWKLEREISGLLKDQVNRKVLKMIGMK